MSEPALSDAERFIPSADNRARLHVTVDGNGPPLLLVHGWPLDLRIFAPQIPVLSRELTVIAWDRRGFGRSTGTPSLDSDLADIEHLLDELGLDRVHLLGMSQGGRLALRFALANPERVRSLLLQAPAVDGYTATRAEEPIPLDEYAALVRAGRIEDMRVAWAAHPMMSAGVDDTPTKRALAGILADYEGADLLARGDRPEAPPVNVAGRVEMLEMPVLILTGLLETPARREHAAFLRLRLPRAREVLFRHSGHLCNVTEPAAYNRAVLEFCRAPERVVSGGGAQD